MPVDPELVRRKIRFIQEDLGRLRPLAALDPETYLRDDANEIVTERLLERIIGRMIDINYHILTETKGVPPIDYFTSFRRLADLGIVPPDRAEALARTAGLRNRLAHEYNGLDERLVHAAARTAAEEVPEYLRAVEAFLTGRTGT